MRNMPAARELAIPIPHERIYVKDDLVIEYVEES